MDKLLAFWKKEKKNKHGNHYHNQYKMFSEFVLSEDGMIGNEDPSVLSNLSQLMAEKLRNQFHTYVVGSTVGSQSRSRGRAPAWSTDLSLPVSYGIGIRTGPRDWASAWHNKLRAVIILCAHSHHFFTTNVPPLSPLFQSSSAHCHWLHTRDSLRGPGNVHFQHSGSWKEIYWHKMQKFWHKKQGSDRYQTETRMPKVTDIYYNRI